MQTRFDILNDPTVQQTEPFAQEGDAPTAPAGGLPGTGSDRVDSGANGPADTLPENVVETGRDRHAFESAVAHHETAYDGVTPPCVLRGFDPLQAEEIRNGGR